MQGRTVLSALPYRQLPITEAAFWFNVREESAVRSRATLEIGNWQSTIGNDKAIYLAAAIRSVSKA